MVLLCDLHYGLYTRFNSKQLRIVRAATPILENYYEKKEKIWLSPTTKATSLTEKPQKQRDNIQTPPKTSIIQQLRIDLGWSVGVTIATQLVWLSRFTETQPSHLPQKLCNQKDIHLKIWNSSSSFRPRINSQLKRRGHIDYYTNM